MNDIIFAIIETKTIPSRMHTAIAGIEVLMGIAGKIAQTFYFIFYSVRVDNIHYDGNTLLMSCINECFQLFGSSESRRGSKERANVITEAAIIRMLLNGHNLNAIIAVFHDTRQHIVFKFGVGSYFFSILPHPDVALVNK